MKVKDKKIKVYRKVVTGTGVHEGISYKALYPAPLWAYYRDLSTKELYAARACTSKSTCIFTVNYHPEIQIYDVIDFNGEKYKVDETDRFERGKHDIKLTCSTFVGSRNDVFTD
jgi:SPP1 family predicted phage head-tail adaptor